MILLAPNNYDVTVVIGDSHATPGVPNNRFEALSNFLSVLKPTNIVQIGDFLTLDSLSTHTLSSLVTRENHRLVDDIDVGRDAYTKLMGSIKKGNITNSIRKKRQYHPHMYWLEGNHEDRSWRYIQEMRLEGWFHTNRTRSCRCRAVGGAKTRTTL